MPWEGFWSFVLGSSCLVRSWSKGRRTEDCRLHGTRNCSGFDGVVEAFLAVPAVAIATVVGRRWLGWRSDDNCVVVTGRRSGGCHRALPHVPIAGVLQQAGPELPSVLDTHSAGVRHDRQRGFALAVRTSRHRRHDRRSEPSSSVPIWTSPARGVFHGAPDVDYAAPCGLTLTDRGRAVSRSGLNERCRAASESRSGSVLTRRVPCPIVNSGRGAFVANM